jgi:hypothetical protein
MQVNITYSRNSSASYATFANERKLANHINYLLTIGYCQQVAVDAAIEAAKMPDDVSVEVIV